CCVDSNILNQEPEYESFRIRVLHRINELKRLIQEDSCQKKVDSFQPHWWPGRFDEDGGMFHSVPDDDSLEVQMLSDEDVMMVEEEDEKIENSVKYPEKRRLTETNMLPIDPTKET